MSKYHILDENLLKEVLFNDYQIIKKMSAPAGNKIKMLSTLFSINPNSWRVVGITPAALEIFKEHNFKKVSGMGINRSHLVQRYPFYESLLKMDITNPEDFWHKYYSKDVTVLATSSENMKNSPSITKESIYVPNDERSLFRTAGYAWKHKEEEEKFLSELFVKFKNNEPSKFLHQSDDYKNTFEPMLTSK
jgi:hypothetical protein